MVLALLAIAAVAPGAPQADEDALELRADPGQVDTVTVYVPADGTDPQRLVDRMTATADLPVYGVSVEPVADPVGVSDGETVGGETSYLQVSFETDLDRRSGELQREISPMTLTGLLPSGSPTVTLETPRGVVLDESDGKLQHRGVFTQTYSVHGTGTIAYGFPRERLAPLVGVLAGAAVVPFVALRLYARRVERSADSAADAGAEIDGLQRLQRVHGYATVLSVVASVGAGLLLGVVGLASLLFDAHLSARPTGAWWGVTQRFLALAPFAVVPLFATLLADRPARNRLGDVGVTRRGALLGGARSFVGLAAALWAGAIVVLAVPRWLVANPIAVGVAVGAAVALHGVTRPYLTRLRTATEPDEGLREEVQRVWDGDEHELRSVYAVEDGGEDLLETGLLPGRHDVYVGSEFRRRLDAAERRALLAHELGHVAHGHLGKRIAVAAGFSSAGLFLFGAMLPGDGLGPFLLVALPLAIVGRGWLTVVQEHQADRYAAAATDVDAVVSALERLEESRTVQSGGGVGGLFSASPSAAERIDHLHAHVGGDDEAPRAPVAGQEGD